MIMKVSNEMKLTNQMLEHVVSSTDLLDGNNKDRLRNFNGNNTNCRSSCSNTAAQFCDMEVNLNEKENLKCLLNSDIKRNSTLMSKMETIKGSKVNGSGACVSAVKDQGVKERKKRVNRRRGTPLTANFSVRKTSERLVKDYDNVIDNQFERQRRAEARQNRTLVEPKFNMVTREEKIVKSKTLRGKARAAQHHFMKELVQSNTTKNVWDVVFDEPEPQEQDLESKFWAKKDKKKKGYSNLRTSDLEECLVVSDIKLKPDNDVDMYNQEETLSTPSVTSVSAVTEQSKQDDLNKAEMLCEQLSYKISKLEEENTILKNENSKIVELEASLEKAEMLIQQLVGQMTSLDVTEVESKTTVEDVVDGQCLSAEPTKVVAKVVAKAVVKAVKKKVAKDNKKEKNPKKTSALVKNRGCEQSNNTVQQSKAIQQKLIVKPRNIVARDSTKVKCQKISEWYNFDEDAYIKQQQSMASPRTGDSYKKVLLQQQKEEEVEQKVAKVKLAGKPAGVPLKRWNYWLSVEGEKGALVKAHKFLFKEFKTEMFKLKQRWTKHCKEFNPFLTEPNYVWKINVHFDQNIDSPFEFIQKWRALALGFTPKTAIQGDWFKSQQQC